MPRDIEEFLKMAAARRAQQKQQAGGQPPVARPVQPPPQQPPKRPPLHQVDDDEIQIISEDPGILVGSSVTEHVQAHLDTSDIAEHVSHLGEQVGLADEKLESRLQQKFDHGVGHLKIDPNLSAQSQTTSVTRADVSRIAAELVQMLQTPSSVRHAIILNEILKRPEI